MLNRIIFLIVVCFSFSCSQQQRLTRLLRNHPELQNISDTVIYTDTIVRMQKVTDTVVSTKIDTVNIFSTDSTVRVRLIHIRDSIKVNILQKSDTVFIMKKIPVKKVVYDPVKPIWYNKRFLSTIIFSLLLILTLISCLKKHL